MAERQAQTTGRGLNRRQGRILRFVVEQFVHTGHPVGSRTLSRLRDEHLSPASIRNTMADLEEMGLLTQPHTSAGRVPTDSGYRYYVDTLMEPSSLPIAEQHEISDFFKRFSGVMTTMLENTSRMLSRYSHHIGIVASPRFESLVFNHIEFVRQGPGRVMVVFVAQNGTVHNKVVTVGGDYNQEYLDRLSRWVVDHFKGLTLAMVRERVQDLLGHERTQYDLLMRQALFLSRQSFGESFGDEALFIEGTSNLVRDPDFSDKVRIDEILEAIERKTTLLELISNTMNSEGVQVVIGSESQLEQMQGCSLVACAYNFPDGSRGSVAVLGPKRMAYPRTIYLVDFMSRQISRIEA